MNHIDKTPTRLPYKYKKKCHIIGEGNKQEGSSDANPYCRGLVDAIDSTLHKKASRELGTHGKGKYEKPVVIK